MLFVSAFALEVTAILWVVTSDTRVMKPASYAAAVACTAKISLFAVASSAMTWGST